MKLPDGNELFKMAVKGAMVTAAENRD